MPKLTPEYALKFTKLSVSPMGTWPSTLKSTKRELIFREIRWWISFLIILSFIFAEIRGIREHYHNSVIVTQSICFFMGSMQIWIKMIIFKCQSMRLKMVTLGMEDFIKRMNDFERTILQRYVDKFAMFHLAMTFSYYTICVAFILGPTILPRPFPTFAEYPFKVESHPIHEIIYFQQAFVGIQAAVGVTIDCQIAFLLWYTGARFEILTIKLINIVNEDELNDCIKLHHDLLRYGKDVIKAIRFIILTSIGVSSVCIIFGGVQFLFVDNLMEMSSAVGSAAYQSNWIDKSKKMKSSIYSLIQRSQKPLTISIDGILPSLSLQYYLSNQTNNIIMKFTNEAALKFTKRSVALLVAWPPPTNTSKKKLFFLDVYFYVSFLSAQIMLMALANGMYVHRNNSEMIIELICLAITMINMTIKMMICRWQRSNLQSIIEEMENIIKQAMPYEQAILEKYVNRSAILHISLTFGFYLAGTNIALGPIFLPQSLPNFAAYPFNTESHPIYEIIYFQQALSAVQACTAAAIDCQVAFLLWFAGARFEMLKVEFANIVDEYDLTRCIEKHGQILSYAEKIVKTVRTLIFTATVITGIIIVISGLIFIFSNEVAVKFQFLVLDIVAVIQLFLNSYPAENLIQMSTAIGMAAYNLNWMDNSRKMWKNVYFLIQRSQKPITVCIPGFIPALSLTYYMSFLSSSFSYFTTLRAFIN
ncbi:uncharacterized protein LOC124956829 [Vespa velutina]|uniref:uncharacterized protein LOC124956829 n=1 Tax=Vespa velutina TaxID=202808 RepID=UPI001FB3DE14|nr:uncharacterized protein LOC124956829 [Vespa velutina]